MRFPKPYPYTRSQAMYNTDMQKTVIRMRAEGKSIRSIADELQLSPTTVCQWNKEFTSDIRESHKQELEDILEGLHATKIQRTRALVKAFKNIELYIQNKEFNPNDLRIYNMLIRLDRYIAQDIMHDVPPLPPKHICPDPVINVITDMPIPPPRTKPQVSDNAMAEPQSDPATAASDDSITDSPGTTATPDNDESNLEHTTEHTTERTTFVARGNHHRVPVQQSRTTNPAPGTASGAVQTIHQKSFGPGDSGSPTRDTINIHVDRNRNVTVSKIPKGTLVKR